MTKQKRLETIIERWEKDSLQDIANQVDLTPAYVQQLATQMRREGVVLPRKKQQDKVNWAKLVTKSAALYAEETPSVHY